MKKRLYNQFKMMTLNVLKIADDLQIKTQKSNAIWIESKLNKFIDDELELAQITRANIKENEIHLSSMLIGTKIVYWLERLTKKETKENIQEFIKDRLSRNSIEIGYKDNCLFSNRITLKDKEVLDENNANS